MMDCICQIVSYYLFCLKLISPYIDFLFTHKNCRVCRGTEKGMFEFGGSTVILMTEPGKVQPDEDLIRNTEAGYETLVKLGEQVGRKIKV